MVIAAIALAMGSASARAVVILSNLPGTEASGTQIGVDGQSTVLKAVGLTTGGSALAFTSLEALISSNTAAGQSPNVGGDVTGGIFSSVSGAPGAPLAAFTPVSIPDSDPAAIRTFTIAGGFTLLANTSYWFVLTGPNVDSGILWSSFNPLVTPTATGVTFDGFEVSTNGGANWNSSFVSNGVRINADVSDVPEPTTAAMIGAMMSIGLLRRRKA